MTLDSAKGTCLHTRPRNRLCAGFAAAFDLRQTHPPRLHLATCTTQ